jgi:hypothetical protein
MARPQKPIDLKLLEDLARIQCTNEEMASILGFTREGFRKRKQRQPELVGVTEKGKEAGRCSLRRLQWKSAAGCGGSAVTAPADTAAELALDGAPGAAAGPRPLRTIQHWVGRCSAHSPNQARNGP